MQHHLSAAAILPTDHDQATLLGRVWLPAAGGPRPVLVRGADLFDLSSLARTVSQLLELPAPLMALREAPPLPRIASLADALRNADPRSRDPAPAR